MDKRSITFNLSTGQNKIKIFSLHPKKPWIAVVTINNTFSLWNYQQKILIKSFNCNTLDESGNVDIKELVFYDKHCLAYQNQSLSSMKNNIIFATNFKIFFYDYITDGIKQINQSQIQKKNIRKVCPYSQTKICIGLSDGSMKLYDNKDSIKHSMVTKTIKGYHFKPITHLFTYCQNINQTPRVISVSAGDGQMACWNVETILANPHQQNTQFFSPSFKFERHNGPKGQEIRCFQYDRQTYKILTMSEHWISIWSTMTGMQLKRIKNQYKFKQILFFNHFSYGINSFLGVGQGTCIEIVKISAEGKLVMQDQINLKNLIKQHADISIQHIHNMANNPSQLFIETASGLVVLEINSTYRPIYGFNTGFITKLSTINSKQFVIKSEGKLNPQIKPEQVRNIKFEKDILFNCFYLSVDTDWVYFNLLEIQIENILHQHRKYKFFKFESSSMLNLSQGSQSIIQISYDGKAFFIFNKALSYYEVYNVIEQKYTGNLLQLNQDKTNSLDFYSQFQVLAKGFCRDIVWHQYKNQFAALCAFDKKQEMISYQTSKQKKGIFKGSTVEQILVLCNQIDHWCACIFQKSTKTNKYLLIEKSKPIKSQIYRIVNLGTIYGYSSQQKSSTQTIQCFSEDQNIIKEVQGLGFFPLKVIVSYCETYQIFTFDNYFIVFKIQENGYYGYWLTVHEKVMEGIFWQKFFIFATKNQMFWLQLTSTGKVLIKIGNSSPSIVLQKNKSAFQTQFIDDIQPQIGMLPEGQLQFLTIVNFHLIILNQNQNVYLFSLKKNPYIQFCIQMVSGTTQQLANLYKRSSNHIKSLMKQTLQQYGISLPHLQPTNSEINFLTY